MLWLALTIASEMYTKKIRRREVYTFLDPRDLRGTLARPPEGKQFSTSANLFTILASSSSSSSNLLSENIYRKRRIQR